MMKKRILSLLSVLVLLLATFAMFAVSAETENTVYLSDNGDDNNTGLTAATAIKTYKKAIEVLGEGGGVILIPDTYTYLDSNAYYMGYVKSSSYIIRGVTSDAKFIHQRKNIAMQNPITFDNLQYVITAANEYATLYACGNRLEFTSTVTVVPRNNEESRNNYLFIMGGEGKETKSTELVLNGGTFGYIYCGAKGKAVSGDVKVTVGGNAHLLDRLYVGSSGAMGDVLGKTTVTITGGTIDKEIYLGGSDAQGAAEITNYVTGNTEVTITGGTFGKIYCHGSAGAKNEGKITVDVSGYAPAKEENWGKTNILDRSKITYVIGENPESYVITATSSTTEKPTTTQNPPKTTTAPATNTDDIVTTESEEQNAGEGGCFGVASASVAILTLGGAGILPACKRKKKEH